MLEAAWRGPRRPATTSELPPRTTPNMEVQGMQIGFVGLGRMGANMVRRLLRDGHEVVAYNRTPEKTKEIAGEGAIAAFSIEELV
jgi:phosphoglycerate dehydrogenase-like enzyme